MLDMTVTCYAPKGTRIEVLCSPLDTVLSLKQKIVQEQDAKEQDAKEQDVSVTRMKLYKANEEESLGSFTI